MVSNPFNYRRADGLILYGRCNPGEHNAVALGVVLQGDRLPDEVFDSAVQGICERQLNPHDKQSSLVGWP